MFKSIHHLNIDKHCYWLNVRLPEQIKNIDK
jgi:hypothetical protein